MPYLRPLNPQLFKNIAYVGCFKHFSVQLFLHVFCNSTKSSANRNNQVKDTSVNCVAICLTNYFLLLKSYPGYAPGLMSSPVIFCLYWKRLLPPWHICQQPPDETARWLTVQLHWITTHLLWRSLCTVRSVALSFLHPTLGGQCKVCKERHIGVGKGAFFLAGLLHKSRKCQMCCQFPQTQEETYWIWNYISH